MIKPANKTLLLTQAVLASTLFLSPLGYATDFNAPGFPAQTTSGNGDVVNIQTLGSIVTNAAGVSAVTLDSVAVSGQVTIQPGNTVATGAIQVGAAAANGILVTQSNGVINIGGTVGANTSKIILDVGTVGDAIKINAGVDNTSITNAGTILGGTKSVIEIAGTNTKITNSAGGILQSGAGAVVAPTINVAVGATGLNLTNAGTIHQVKLDQQAILLKADFGTITNSGTITQSDGGAVSKAVIELDATVTAGSIVNQQLGTISQSGGGAIAAETILINATGGTVIVDNAGTISNAAAANATILVGAGANILSITNQATGVISNTADSAITLTGILGNTVTGLVNFGTISSTGADAIDFAAGTAKGGIYQNGGVITGDVRLASLDGGLKGNVFTMSGGLITGNVISSGNAGQSQTFALSGGIIAGNLDGTAGTLANTFNITGGAVTGDVHLGGVGDTVNLSGATTLNTITGGGGIDTINILPNASKLSFNLLDGKGGNDTLNINTTFSTSAVTVINSMDLINVNDAGTVFSLLNKITNMGVSLIINPGTTMVMAGSSVQGTAGAGATVDISGQLTVQGASNITLTGVNAQVINNGILELTRASNLTITGDRPNTFLNKVGGRLQTDLGIVTPGGLVSPGVMTLTDAAGPQVFGDLVAGSFVVPNVVGFVPNGTVVPLITATTPGDTITDLSTLINNSAIVNFVKAGNGTAAITLTANNNSFASFGGSANSGIAGFLDSIAGTTDPNFLALLTAFQQIPTAQGVIDAEQSLTPVGTNGSILMSSLTTMGAVFDAASDRSSELRGARHRHVRKHRHAAVETSPMVRVAQKDEGLSYGDPDGAGALWVRALGGHADQDSRDDFAGYDSDFAGAALGFDWGVNDCVTLGLAGSYAKTSISDDAVNPKDISVKSWQVTGYGWFEYVNGWYLDAMAAYGWNDYDSNRTISVNPNPAPGQLSFVTAAQGDFDGHQWGGQADLGWRMWSDNCSYFTPFARLRYISTDVDSYTESGADFLNLAVDGTDYHEFLGGLGFRLGTRIESGDVAWIPELTAMIGYDFDLDGSSITAAFPAFTGGASTFATNGMTPGRTIFDLGLGLSANMSERSTLTLKYNLELRDDYVGNAGYLQFYYLFS